MTEGEIKELIFVCPYHGRIDRKYVTTIKTCGKCMEELCETSGDTTLLQRAPFEKHSPRWQYDCGRCKFAWCCGPQCSCSLEEEDPPKERMEEVEKAQEMWRKK